LIFLASNSIEMMQTKDKFFIDSNICLYLLSGEIIKKQIALELLSQNGIISTQVLSENINVLFKKFKTLSTTDIQTHIHFLVENSTVKIIDVETNSKSNFNKRKKSNAMV